MNRAERSAAVVALAVLGLTASVARGAEKPWRFVVFGATEEPNDYHKAVIEQVVKLKPDLVIHAGGLLEPTRKTSEVRDFAQVAEPILDAFPFYRCRSKYGSRMLRTAPFAPEGVNWGGATYYSFDHKGVHFVSLDSDQRLTAKSPQVKWLDEDLAAAQGKPIIVFFHHAIYNVGRRGGYREGEIYWSPLFSRHKVLAVFSGYPHLYYRTVTKGTTHVVTGGGGAPLDIVLSRRGLMPDDVAGAFHHCIEVVVADGKLRGRVVDSEGRTRDEFLLEVQQEEEFEITP